MAKKQQDDNSIESIISGLRKDHPEAGIAYVSDIDTTVERIPTGIVALDNILGGGLPRGKMAEFFGAPAGGKTSAAMKFIAQAQNYGHCVLFDLENAFDPVMAENSGIDLDRLLIIEPLCAEDTLEMMERLIVSPDIAAVVVDSVAGLVPRAEVEGDFGDSHVGVIGRLTSQACRKFESSMKESNSNTIILWINQIRDKIGSMGYGPKTDTTGGKAIKFWSSTRVEVTRVGNLKKGDEVVGQEVKVYTQKNRAYPPFKSDKFKIFYETGISNGSWLVRLLLDEGLLKKSGSWIVDTSTGESLAQGEDNLAHTFDADQEMFDLWSAKLNK